MQVNLLIHLVEHFQIFEHWQGLCSKGFIELDEVDIGHGQPGTLQGFLGRRYRAVAHDRRVHTSHCHGADHRQRLDTEVHRTLARHDDHARSAIGNLRRSTGCDRTTFGVERRLERCQAFKGGFRANGLVEVEDLQETVLVIALHRDDLVLELAFDRRLVGELVRTQAEQVLLLTGDAVHLAEHLGSQAHHPGSLGSVQGQVRVGVHAMHHADVPHVLDTTDHEHVAVAGHDRLGGGVQRAHRRAAQAADGLGGRGVRDLGHQRRHAGDVPALLQGLVDAAPDHVLDFFGVDLAVALQQLADQVRRHVFSTGVAVHATLGAAHRGATEVDNHHVSWIEAHINNLALLSQRRWLLS
ncbi:hypothetical protein D3C78_897480 [compost metagenome]